MRKCDSVMKNGLSISVLMPLNDAKSRRENSGLPLLNFRKGIVLFRGSFQSQLLVKVSYFSQNLRKRKSQSGFVENSFPGIIQSGKDVMEE